MYVCAPRVYLIPVEVRRRCVARWFLGWVKLGGKTYSKSGQHLDWGPGLHKKKTSHASAFISTLTAFVCLLATV